MKLAIFGKTGITYLIKNIMFIMCLIYTLINVLGGIFCFDVPMYVLCQQNIKAGLSPPFLIQRIPIY
jgi:hypothetical protein